MKQLIVKKEIILFEFLKNNLSLSKNSIKNLLHDKYIYVNDICTTKYDHLLKENDIVQIKSSIDIDILYEDKDIIVVNKPYNLLTVTTDNKNDKTLYKMVSNYVKTNNKNNKIFIVHRLDKDTSGVVMFAKNEKIKSLYQNNWNDIVKERKYYAIVEGILKNKKDTIKSYLKEDKNNMVYSAKEGKLAITNYEVLKEYKDLSLLDINLSTGRKNQIRVHFKEMNAPIYGDSKYGKKIKDRMYLHAYRLKLMNPINKKIMTFETNMPKEFEKLIFLAKK